MGEITCHKCGDVLIYLIGCGWSASYQCGFCGFKILIPHSKLDRMYVKWDK